VEAKELFGANLRRLRHDAGLTQMELSNRSGLDMAEISRLETGIRDVRLSTIVRLADGLEVPVQALLTGLGRFS
jgi:transcriptional regulator with XRE-family HTH domain